MVAEAVARAVGDGEGKGFQPGCAALGQRGEDDVVAAGLEGVLEQHDVANQVRSAPVVLVQNHWLRPPFPCWQCADEVLQVLG